jgi:hypothetical protein
MKSLQEIKAAIATLGAREKAILAAELFADAPVPSDAELRAALEKGMQDVEAGRVQPLGQAKDQLKRWVVLVKWITHK